MTFRPLGSCLAVSTGRAPSNRGTKDPGAAQSSSARSAQNEMGSRGPGPGCTLGRARGDWCPALRRQPMGGEGFPGRGCRRVLSSVTRRRCRSRAVGAVGI